MPVRPGPATGTKTTTARDLASLAPEVRLSTLRARAESGESAVLMLLLAREEARLARLAATAGDEEGASLGRAEAVRHGLAAYVAMRTASPICSDRTSPDEYLHELGETLQPLLAWLAGQDDELRRGVAEAALALETKVNVPGRPDPLLCRRGQHGDRFCPPGADEESCPPDAAPMAEFTLSEPRLQHQSRMRLSARAELTALAR